MYDKYIVPRLKNVWCQIHHELHMISTLRWR